jgi:hypothetical protein
MTAGTVDPKKEAMNESLILRSGAAGIVPITERLFDQMAQGSRAG